MVRLNSPVWHHKDEKDGHYSDALRPVSASSGRETRGSQVLADRLSTSTSFRRYGVSSGVD